MSTERPTPQGPNAGGPGNRHATPPRDAPAPWGTGEAPFDPRGGQPATDPEAAAKALLDQANPGQPAGGDAGPMAAGAEKKGP
ncbi:hypothetical protein JMJ55_09425 [Belnapia sp. T6]|uniref:Uncharacterized protein n=1 Tax=Belnapia mucosa TaxID=2804532 RepID=A0ABS1V2N5_9PROT|nr:hypothetical protein [Belnapia mucosa]MBL6455542.1 hypothetical protein [Belnapia mucosa]